jgi:hypothetical protein
MGGTARIDISRIADTPSPSGFAADDEAHYGDRSRERKRVLIIF